VDTVYRYMLHYFKFGGMTLNHVNSMKRLIGVALMICAAVQRHSDVIRPQPFAALTGTAVHRGPKNTTVLFLE